MDSHDRLLTDEIGLLLRYWIINNDNLFDIPDSLEDMSKMKHDAIDLLESLHSSYIKPMASVNDWKQAFEESFPKASRLKEAIFYCGENLHSCCKLTQNLPFCGENCHSCCKSDSLSRHAER